MVTVNTSIFFKCVGTQPTCALSIIQRISNWCLISCFCSCDISTVTVTVASVFVAANQLYFKLIRDSSLYRISPVAASLLCGIFYSAFFTVNSDWLRGFTVV